MVWNIHLMINPRLNIRTSTNLGIDMAIAIVEMIYPHLYQKMVINLGTGMENGTVIIICRQLNVQTVTKNGTYTALGILLNNKIEFIFFVLITLYIAATNMDTLPIELVTIIAVDTFELFTTLLLVPTIGQRLCEQYPQMYARKKFITTDIDNKGVTRTHLNDELHSVNDQPAIIYANGGKEWYRFGKLHRKDLPAVVFADGTKKWFWNGKRHRGDDLPAAEIIDGSKMWYRYGELYRSHDKPTIIGVYNGKFWYYK